MTGADFLGWVSSFVLLGTMLTQVRKQWNVESSKGVSKWLYLGQIFSGIGFVVYSMLLKNWVFVFSNSALLLLNLAGLALLLKHKLKGNT